MDASEFRVGAVTAATEATAALTDREKHLVGLAVTVTRGCQACTGRRIQVALAAGVPYAAVVAAIDLAAAVNAGVTLRTAIEGAKQAGVGAACGGTECVVGVAQTPNPARQPTADA
jgi:alkylhydroperoxidase/carboxymuconolactone decarboxylase family protein YurZ